MPDTRQNLSVIEMTSEIYQVTYKARSPIHIGYRSIGILKTTRYYITGSAIWGAITAVMTRYLMGTPVSKYKRVGEFVKKNIRTTYFFPKVNNIVYHPVYQNGEVRYGDISESAFEKIFIHSFVSTALDKRKTADEDTLHEVEFVRNEVRMEKDIRDVCWVGYFFVNEKKGDLEIEIEDNDFIIKGDREMKASEVLKKIQVGGERNYGFGRLELSNSFEKIDKNTGKVFGCRLDRDRIRSRIALSHVYYRNIAYMGEVEPLVGRKWGAKGSGRESSIEGDTNFVFFAPGTRFTHESVFEVADCGVWNWTRNDQAIGKTSIGEPRAQPMSII
jgi:hypothetical protein